MLPIDLVLVRHGQSVGNEAQRSAEQGDHSAARRLADRHTSSFGLTQLGRDQALMAGDYLTGEFFSRDQQGFGRCSTSEYARAMETAGLLVLPGAEWFADFHLTERDWGDFDHCPSEEREARFGDALRRRDVEPFFWRPPNGESFAQLCLRVDRVLHTLHRECGDKRVILVCHGEVMWAFRVRLERMSQVRFKQLHLSKNPLDRIHNCQIMHYTRRDPETSRLAPYANWMRMIRPTERPVWSSGWQPIVRPRYTNEQLLAVVRDVTAVIP
jgi:NAD+ kinase